MEAGSFACSSVPGSAAHPSSPLHAQGGISTQTDPSITGWTDEESSQADASIPSSPASTVRARSVPLSDGLGVAFSLASANSLPALSPRSLKRGLSSMPAAADEPEISYDDDGPVKEPPSWLAARDLVQDSDVLQTLLAASATLLALEVGGQSSQVGLRRLTGCSRMHA